MMNHLCRKSHESEVKRKKKSESQFLGVHLKDDLTLTLSELSVRVFRVSRKELIGLPDLSSVLENLSFDFTKIRNISPLELIFTRDDRGKPQGDKLNVSFYDGGWSASCRACQYLAEKYIARTYVVQNSSWLKLNDKNVLS